MLSDEPLIRCQRCKQPGGQAFHGWAILCEECIEEELAWFRE